MATTAVDLPSLLDEHWVYWEPQQRLNCAVHSCNSVLQTALFRSQNFEKIARKLDEEEASYLHAARPSASGHNKQHRKSNNFDASGNFSVQVVICALSQAS